MAIPPLLAKKFINNSKNISNSFTSLTSTNTTNSNSNDESSTLSDSISTLETFFNFQNNAEEIKEVRNQLIQNATLINYLNVVDFNNLEMSKTIMIVKMNYHQSLMNLLILKRNV